MDAHKVKGGWAIAKGRLKKWADLTDGDFHDAGGKLDELAGGIQMLIGRHREAVEHAIKDAFSSCCQ